MVKERSPALRYVMLVCDTHYYTGLRLAPLPTSLSPLLNTVPPSLLHHVILMYCKYYNVDGLNITAIQ